MSLNIKNERVHTLVRRLAELTGQSQTSAVEDAVARRLAGLDQERKAVVARRAAAIDAAAAHARQNLSPGRTAAEIVDDIYDEAGLPR